MLSDDSPFVDTNGKVHAFPLHLGLPPSGEEEVPEEHRGRINRMELRAMTTNCIIGLGLFHGIEFILASKAGLAASRLHTSLSLMRRSETIS